MSGSAYPFVSGLLGPITGSRLVRPITRRYDGLAALGEAALERWVDAGRTAEQRSRALARQAYDEGSTEVIQVAVAQLAGEPAVRDLVTHQGTGLAIEIRDALRERTARADARWTLRPAGATEAGHLQPAGFVSRLLALVIDIVWPRALWRYIGYFLSALPLFLGYFWVLGDSRRRGWHDKLVNTQVVYTWDLPHSE